MIEISVKFFASLAETLGEKETMIALKEESNVQDLLYELKQKYGVKFEEIVFQPNGKLNETHKILLNENNLPKHEIIEIKLKNKDIIAILPPIGGGYR